MGEVKVIFFEKNIPILDKCCCEIVYLQKKPAWMHPVKKTASTPGSSY